MDDLHNELSGWPGQIVQARDIHGGDHLYDRRPPSPPPRLLPPNVAHFIGRAPELAKLDALLDTDAQPPAVVISAIAGAAGMGKTALAVHWSHRMCARFPDGQLYVNLRGYDAGPPVTPEAALDGFLRAFDVPGERIPHGLDAMAGYYRSLLAGRRMLVVIDNAATSEQVRPLLPASPTCAVVVTSRSRLSGLVARDGAQRITLDLLAPDEARTLVHNIIGPIRAAEEPEAVSELLRRCAYLPLALRIAAERVVARPHHRVSDLLEDLRAEQDRLDTLAAGDDETTAVRTVFSWSYRALTPEAARVFRLLGLHPGPDISVLAAAALTGLAEHKVRRLLNALADVHLVTETTRDRYTFHDLLRTYAAERAAMEEPEPERIEALDRMFAWYLHTAHSASKTLNPHPVPLPIQPPQPGCQFLSFPAQDQALQWCDAELSNVLAIIEYAHRESWRLVASELPMAIGVYLYFRAHWTYSIPVCQIGLTAARHLGNEHAEFRLLAFVGSTYIDLERYDDAAPCFRSALDIARARGDRPYEAAARHDLGLVDCGLGRFEDAVDHFRHALTIYREVGDLRGEGLVLVLTGDSLRKQGRAADALDIVWQGLAVLRKSRSRLEEAIALRRLGLVHLDLHQVDDAIKHFQQAMAIHEAMDHGFQVARTLHDLGEAYRRAGRHGEAIDSWRAAVVIFEQLNSPQASRIRARLAAIPAP